MLHVWNIYYHLPHKWPSHVGKYSSTMEHMGFNICSLSGLRGHPPPWAPGLFSIRGFGCRPQGRARRYSQFPKDIPLVGWIRPGRFTTFFVFFEKKKSETPSKLNSEQTNLWFLMRSPWSAPQILGRHLIQGAPNLGSPASSFGSVCPVRQTEGTEDGPIIQGPGWWMGFPDRNVSISTRILVVLSFGGCPKIGKKTYNNLKFPGNPEQNPKFCWFFHGFFQIVPVDFWNKPVMGCS